MTRPPRQVVKVERNVAGFDMRMTIGPAPNKAGLLPVRPEAVTALVISMMEEARAAGRPAPTFAEIETTISTYCKARNGYVTRRQIEHAFYGETPATLKERPGKRGRPPKSAPKAEN